jgi:hypothetical protein
LFGVTWVGQYKQYNPYHVLTKSFWISKDAYNNFLDHYSGCIVEYKKRFGKDIIWRSLLVRAWSEIHSLLDIIPDKTIEQQNLDYLLNEKKRFLTKDDLNRLQKITI